MSYLSKTPIVCVPSIPSRQAISRITVPWCLAISRSMRRPSQVGCAFVNTCRAVPNTPRLEIPLCRRHHTPLSSTKWLSRVLPLVSGLVDPERSGSPRRPSRACNIGGNSAHLNRFAARLAIDERHISSTHPNEYHRERVTPFPRQGGLSLMPFCLLSIVVERIPQTLPESLLFRWWESNRDRGSWRCGICVEQRPRQLKREMRTPDCGEYTVGRLSAGRLQTAHCWNGQNARPGTA
jgi:hypothetical protein